MAKFVYNNVKNTSTGQMPLELNCGYYSRESYQNDIDSCFRLRTAEKQSLDLLKLMFVCRENLYPAQKLQNRSYNKYVKSINYAISDKIWLKNKSIQIKRNWKLEPKLFGSFWVLYLVANQVYQFELPKKWRYYDVFHVFWLKQDTTRKERVDENTT